MINNLKKQKLKEQVIESLLFLSGMLSILITLSIVSILIFESWEFFKNVSIISFLTDTVWMPLFDNPRYGILPLLNGTLLSSFIGLIVAIPIGLTISVYLSEFASSLTREIIKPILELFAGIPTVVFGYFALFVITPALQATIMPNLPGFNVLSAGLVIGIMIIPYISSLSEDAMRSVPMSLREASFAMGATKIETAIKVVVPAAISGIGAACILAMSRAVGETMIVAIAAGQQPNLTLDPTQAAATITAYIVQVALGDLPHGSVGYQSIFAAGLVLFVITFIFNIIGFFLKKRFREVYE